MSSAIVVLSEINSVSSEKYLRNGIHYWFSLNSRLLKRRSFRTARHLGNVRIDDRRWQWPTACDHPNDPILSSSVFYPLLCSTNFDLCSNRTACHPLPTQRTSSLAQSKRIQARQLDPHVIPSHPDHLQSSSESSRTQTWLAPHPRRLRGVGCEPSLGTRRFKALVQTRINCWPCLYSYIALHDSL